MGEGLRVGTTQGIVFIGALYHPPPNPIYDEQMLLTRLERTIEVYYPGLIRKQLLSCVVT